MANVVKWSNVQVAIQSALATAIAIVSISKANPAVVAYAGGVDPVDGDYVKLSVQGMYQVNDRVFRVANVNAGSDTFELEGEDSTSYDDFTSGTLEVITFGTTMATVSGLTASGGDFDFIDVTTIHDNIKKQVPGAANPAVYSLENLWDATDAALLALKTASDNQSVRAFRFSFAGGEKVAFLGYVGATLLPVGNAQDKVTTPVSVTMFGKPTIYST